MHVIFSKILQNFRVTSLAFSSVCLHFFQPLPLNSVFFLSRISTRQIITLYKKNPHIVRELAYKFICKFYSKITSCKSFNNSNYLHGRELFL